MFVGISEVSSHNGSEQLWRRDGMLLGHYIDCLLHGVCGDNDAIICFSVATTVNWQSFKSFIVLSSSLTRSQSRLEAIRRRSFQRRYVLWSSRHDGLYKLGCYLCHTGLQKDEAFSRERNSDSTAMEILIRSLICGVIFDKKDKGREYLIYCHGMTCQKEKESRCASAEHEDAEIFAAAVLLDLCNRVSAGPDR